MRKIIALILVMLFISCEEDQLETENNPETNAVETLNEFAFINQVFQDVGNNGGDAVLSAESSTTGKNSQSKNNPIITVEPLDFVTFPKTTTVNFGNGTLCKDGITRKGIITIVSTDWYREPGSMHTSTFSDYYHGEFKVEGTHIVQNIEENDDGYLVYRVLVNDGKVTSNNGNSAYYSEDSFRTWIAGSNTPLNIWDDEYLLQGKQLGTSSQGVDYSLTVEEALHFVLLPRSIKSGILDMEIGEISNIKVNYTLGTFTILGKTYSWN